MADEMTKEEFSEYMTGFEQRIADRFGRTDRRLDGLDRRFDKVDGRLESMDGRLDSMDGRLDSMDSRLDSMDGRLDEHDSRFDAVEKEMKRGFSDLAGGLIANQELDKRTLERAHQVRGRTESLENRVKPTRRRR